MQPEKRSEILAFFWFVVSALTLLSLISYTPSDIPFEVSSPNTPAHDFVGIAGAYTAWVLFLFFGKVAYFLVPLFLTWSFAKWAGKKPQKLWLRIFSVVVLLASACALFSIVVNAPQAARFSAGGIIGFFVSSFLSMVFGNAAMFVAGSLFVLSVLLATELLLLQAAVALFNRALKKLPIAAPPQDIKVQKSPLAPSPAKTEPKLQSTVLPSAAAVKPKPLINLPKPVVETPKPIASKPEIKVNIPAPVGLKTQTTPKQKAAETPAEEEVVGAYRLPTLDILESPPAFDQSKLKEGLEDSSKVLEDTLRDFGIDAKVVQIEQGPTITRYEVQPAAGVKVGRITSLENDIALAMRATSVRIEAPIPGKNAIGIEIPSSSNATVHIREMLASAEYQRENSRVTLALGKDIGGAPIVCNLSDMPHLLIAGATNTGKSVCINSLITSILYKSSPDEVKFLMIDPKMVELHFYNDLPHLITPVITDKAKVPGALAWIVGEMERRYKILSKVGARNITVYNEKVERKEIKIDSIKITEENEDQAIVVKKMPFIVLVIDELADLMMASPQEVETAITRIAQLARAVGIHMILATQRPSVDVITGVIKANFPARIAFQVASKVDSRTILDENGADKLLGRGDMLFMDPRKSKVIRAQGAWVQDKEIERLTEFIKSQRKPVYQEQVVQAVAKKSTMGGGENDEMYEEAKKLVIDTGVASVSYLQRRFGFGYTRAARLIDIMEQEGIVGPYRGAKPREILVESPGIKKAAEEEKAQT